jgi:hypothetical protein
MTMITGVIAKNFKGFEFDQPLGRLTLLVGKNRSGKSSRTQALQLAVNGHLAGVGKREADIVAAFAGKSNYTMVGVRFGKDLVMKRAWVKKEGGGATQSFAMMDAKVNESSYIKTLAINGDPKILNISEFMDLSPQKKIDHLFSLYPPEGDLKSLGAEIDEKKKALNAKESKVRSCEEAAQRLSETKAAVALPAGTVPEKDAEISETEKQITEARESLSGLLREREAAEKKAAEEKAAEEAHKAPAPTAAPSVSPFEALVRNRGQAPAKNEGGPQTFFALCDKMKESVGSVSGAKEDHAVTPAGEALSEKVLRAAEGVISRILETMELSGCSVCAAKMVAKVGLAKIREVAKNG